MSQETERQRTEQAERAAPPRFSESESPPAWLIATRGDLREMEARVNYRIDDAKAESNTRAGETHARIDTTNARIDEIKADGRARDAKLDAHTQALSRIEANQKSESRRKQLAVAWIGIAVAALGIAAGILWNLMG